MTVKRGIAAIVGVILLGAPAVWAQASVYSTTPEPSRTAAGLTSPDHAAAGPTAADEASGATGLTGPGSAGTTGTGAVGVGPTGTMASPGR